MRAYLAIPCTSGSDEQRLLVVDALSAQVVNNQALSTQSVSDLLAQIITDGQAVYGTDWRLVSRIAKIIGLSDTDELIYVAGFIQSGGGLNFIRDVVLLACSPAGSVRTIASDHLRTDAPAWMGAAPELFLAAAGGEEAYLFGLDPDQPDPPEGVLTYAVYALSGTGYAKTAMALPSGFSANSAGQFIKTDNGESMWVISDDQTSASNLHLVRNVQGVWTIKRTAQVDGTSIPLPSVLALTSADGVGSLDYVTGAAFPTDTITAQGMDDLGSYKLISETLTSTGFPGSMSIRDIIDSALGENSNISGPPVFAAHAAYPLPAFWTSLVGVEVQA